MHDRLLHLLLATIGSAGPLSAQSTIVLAPESGSADTVVLAAGRSVDIAIGFGGVLAAGHAGDTVLLIDSVHRGFELRGATVRAYRTLCDLDEIMWVASAGSVASVNTGSTIRLCTPATGIERVIATLPLPPAGILSAGRHRVAITVTDISAAGAAVVSVLDASGGPQVARFDLSALPANYLPRMPGTSFATPFVVARPFGDGLVVVGARTLDVVWIGQDGAIRRESVLSAPARGYGDAERQAYLEKFGPNERLQRIATQMLDMGKPYFTAPQWSVTDTGVVWIAAEDGHGDGTRLLTLAPDGRRWTARLPQRVLAVSADDQGVWLVVRGDDGRQLTRFDLR